MQPETSLRVLDARDGVSLERDTVYVAPPSSSLGVRDGRLVVRPLEAAHGRRTSIDRLFLSLAGAWRERAVGVVLSGMGADGTHGLRAIRAAGGLTLAEEPASAAYAAMPESAIAAGERPSEGGIHATDRRCKER